MGRIVSLLVLVSLFASSAAAFDYEEHKYVSNLALRIALKKAPVELQAKFAELASPGAAERNESFGDLVALADSVSDPNPFFTSQSAQRFNATELDWPHLKHLKSDLFRWAHAAHNNENHFQELALIAHLNNHELAILEAQEEKWVRAVIFEAYAVHFIEDFLSPGHVATGRSGLPDFVAIGLHDRYGAQGLDFRVAKHDDFSKLANGLAGVDFNEQPRSRLLLAPKDFEDLAAKQGELLKLYGDSRLAENKTQAALVVALAARSITEMLLGSDNTFDQYCWAFGEEPTCPGVDYVTIQGRSVLHAARIDYGSYEDSVRLVTLFYPGEILILGHENAYVPGRRSTNPDGRWGLLAETLVLGVPPVYDRKAHVIKRTLRSLTPALVVGGARTFGGEPSTSFHVRAIATIPRTDIHFSTKVGRRIYEVRSGKLSDRSTFGVAVEGGFSFIFVRFGGEWEWDNNVRQGGRLYLSTGISGFIPSRAVLQKLRGGRAPTPTPSSP